MAFFDMPSITEYVESTGDEEMIAAWAETKEASQATKDATVAVSADTIDSTADLGEPGKTTVTDVPEWMKQYYANLFGSATDLIFTQDEQGNITGIKPPTTPEAAAFHAQMTPEQQQALQAMQGQIGTEAGISAQDTLQLATQALTRLQDPSQNPYLQRAVQGAIDPIYQRLQEQVLPGLRGAAVGSGNLGSSRQGIAEALASSRASQAAGDVTSRMYSDAFQQGLGQYNQLLGMMPGFQQALFTPQQNIYDAGLVQQQQQQALQDKQYQQAQWEAMYPFWALEQYGSYIGGDFGGTQTEYEAPGTDDGGFTPDDPTDDTVYDSYEDYWKSIQPTEGVGL